MSVFWRPLGCVLWLEFREPNGDTAYDLSGYGNHGTIYGPKRLGTWLGQGLSFDGVDDRVNCGTGTSLYPTKFTITSLIKRGALTGDHMTFISTHGTTGKGYFMELSPDGVLMTGCGNGTTWNPYFGLDWTTEEDKWYFVVDTWDGTTLKMYVNGVFEKSDTGALVYDYGQPLMLGMRNRPGDENWFRGVLSEVRIYNRALTEKEIKAHYHYLKQAVRGL